MVSYNIFVSAGVKEEKAKKSKKRKEKWGREIERETMRVGYVGQKGC